MSRDDGAGDRSDASHYGRAKQAIQDLATRLARVGETRLPAEDRLAADLGFSRPTVRSALQALQQEGKLLRQHGVGTFINRHALIVRSNLLEDRPFLSVIAEQGHVADLDILRVAGEVLPDWVCERLDEPSGCRGAVVDRLYRASGTPAVLSRDYVPERYLVVPVTEVTAERSTFAFAQRWAERQLRYSVVALRAVAATEHAAGFLDIAPGDPLLFLDHNNVDDQDEVVGVTESYVRDDVLQFAIVRSGTDL